MNKITILIACFSLSISIISASNALADEIFLKNGAVVVGNILEEDDQEIKLQVDLGGSTTIRRSEIYRIDRDSKDIKFSPPGLAPQNAGEFRTSVKRHLKRIMFDTFEPFKPAHLFVTLPLLLIAFALFALLTGLFHLLVQKESLDFGSAFILQGKLYFLSLLGPMVGLSIAMGLTYVPFDISNLWDKMTLYSVITGVALVGFSAVQITKKDLELSFLKSLPLAVVIYGLYYASSFYMPLELPFLSK